MWGAYDGEGSKAFFLGKLFGRAHVNEFEVAVIINHNVFRFQIAVNYVFEMQILQRKQQAPQVQSANLFREDPSCTAAVE